jgi:hypothetical protein
MGIRGKLLDFFAGGGPNGVSLSAGFQYKPFLGLKQALTPRK